MKNNHISSGKGLAIMRIALGLLFLIPGLSKLFAPAGITGMLSGIGFPLAGLFAWILILVEVLGGLSLIFGYKTKYAIWPLIIVIIVAMLTVAMPGFIKSGSMVSLLFHLVSLAGLLAIDIDGVGAWAVKCK